MNINKTFVISFFLISTVIFSGYAMSFLFSSNMNKDEFSAYILDKQHDLSSKTVLSGFKIENFELPYEQFKNIHFKKTKWTNIDAHKRIFENVQFEDCIFTNINFRNTIFNNASFKNCTLTNVVMNKSVIDSMTFDHSQLISTDPNIENNYRELQADSLIFKHSELTNITFYDSKARFYFENSQLNDVSGLGLIEGSALYIYDTNAFDIDFSFSTLSTLEVKNSTIRKSKAGGCSIDTILLENSDLEFSIADGIKPNNVTANNTGSIVIGGTPTTSVHISNCPKNKRVLSVGGNNFDTINIENCSPTELKFYESKGNTITIKDATVSWLDFSASTIENVILKNVHIENTLYYQDTNIKNLETSNITFNEGIEIDRENSNIEIIPDRVLPATY